MTGDYALIEDDGQVTNVIVADEDFAADYVANEDNPFTHFVCVDALDPKPGIGWSYNTQTGEFIAPPAPPAPEPTDEDIAREDAARLLANTSRTSTETTQLISALADLAGVTPEGS